MIDRLAARVQNHYINRTIELDIDESYSLSDEFFRPVIKDGVKGVPKGIVNVRNEFRDFNPDLTGTQLNLITAIELFRGGIQLTLISAGFKAGDRGDWEFLNEQGDR